MMVEATAYQDRDMKKIYWFTTRHSGTIAFASNDSVLEPCVCFVSNLLLKRRRYRGAFCRTKLFLYNPRGEKEEREEKTEKSIHRDSSTLLANAGRSLSDAEKSKAVVIHAMGDLGEEAPVLKNLDLRTLCSSSHNRRRTVSGRFDFV